MNRLEQMKKSVRKVLYKEFENSSLGKTLKFSKNIHPRVMSDCLTKKSFPSTMYVQHGVILNNYVDWDEVDEEMSVLVWDKGIVLPNGGKVYEGWSDINKCYTHGEGSDCIRLHIERPVVDKGKSYVSSTKRAKSAYIFFCMENRPLLREEFPMETSRNITKKLGDRWQKMKVENPDILEKFQEKANFDKLRYQKVKNQMM